MKNNYKVGDVIICIDAKPTRNLHDKDGFGYGWEIGKIIVIASIVKSDSGQQILFANNGTGVYADVVKLYRGEEEDYEIF